MNSTISGGGKQGAARKIPDRKSVNSAMELGVRFSLDLSDGTPIYRQVIKQIEYAVISGRLRSGDQLPTIRALAVELKTNPNTIAKAYGELEIRGILATQVGSGTFISDKKPELAEGPDQKIRELLDRFIRDMRGLGVEKRELNRLISAHKEG